MSLKGEKFAIFLSDYKLPCYTKSEFVKGKTLNEIISTSKIKKGFTLAIRTPTYIQYKDPSTVITNEFPNIVHNKKYDFSYSFQHILIEEMGIIQFIFQCKVDNNLPNSNTPIQMPNFIAKFHLLEYQNKSGIDILTKIASSFGLPHENPRISINNEYIDVSNVDANSLFKQFSNEKNEIVFNCHLTEKALKIIEKKTNLIQELIDSETIFLERLNYMHNFFTYKMKAAKIFQENPEKLKLFNDSIRKIFKYHTNFYVFGLKKLKIEYDDMVSKSFLRLGDSFSINQDLVRHYGILLVLLLEIQKNDSIRKVETSFFNHEKVNVDEITNFLSQRLLKYLSLIKEIRENTPMSHIDSQFLKIVENKMKKILAQVDAFCDSSLNFVEMNKLMKRVEDPESILSSNKNNSLKCFYDVSIAFKNELNEKVPGMIYILNDHLMLTLKETKEKILFYNKIKKQAFVLFHDDQVDSILFFSEINDRFIVNFQSKEKKEKFILIFKQLRSNLIYHKRNQIFAEEILTNLPIFPHSFNLSAASLNKSLVAFSGGSTQKTVSNCSPIITFNSNGNKISILSDESSVTPDSEMRMTHGSSKMSLYLFGGSKTKNIMTYKERKWAELPCPAEFARTKHSFVYYNDYLVVYGGLDEMKKESSDLWLYDVKSNSWSKPSIESEIPPARFDHSAVVYKNLMIVHGGQFNGEKLNDLWTFNFSETKWKQIKIEDNQNLVPRSGHAALIVNQFMVVLGGEKEGNFPFAFNIETSEVIKLKIIGNYVFGMNNFGAAVIENGKRNGKQIILFGGFDNNKSTILNSMSKLSLPDEISNPESITIS